MIPAIDTAPPLSVAVNIENVSGNSPRPSQSSCKRLDTRGHDKITLHRNARRVWQMNHA